MRAIVSALAFVSVGFPAQAGEQAIRVIPITKENAAVSAATIASAKSHLIGAPPAGRFVQQTSLGQSLPAPSSFKNARAEQVDPAHPPATRTERQLKRVEVIKPSPTGGFIVQTFFVQ